MRRDPDQQASYSETEAQRIPARAAEFAVFGSFTLAIIALYGFQSTSPAMAWSLVSGALGSGILAMRATRDNSPVADAATADAR